MKAVQNMLLVIFAGLIIFPSAIDLAHVFSGHKHDYCNHYAESHFHQETVDCELFHFQQNPFSFPPVYSWTPAEPSVSSIAITGEYLFLSTYQKLHFSLRAPPAIA